MDADGGVSVSDRNFVLTLMVLPKTYVMFLYPCRKQDNGKIPEAD